MKKYNTIKQKFFDDLNRQLTFNNGPAFWLALVFVSLLGTSAARAELKVCNNTPSRVGIAVGYKDSGKWSTEGWWNIASNSCEVLLKGKLNARYYYIHAIDYDRGGEWSDKAFMCTKDEEFTIHGVHNCSERGYKRTGFYEIDTKNEDNWTIELQDPHKIGKK